ncbi:NADH-quinone oxidoreductase subunit C [Kroppenstedtia eburnea]|uniref:NADH-quinone oxidoreductase subunit C n=1 Tax=Kroppenstedtia eburnea TaxID=714067 RepID=UPI003639F38A
MTRDDQRGNTGPEAEPVKVAKEKEDPAAQAAKRLAQAKARAADVKKHPAKEKKPPEPPEPSPLQPLLDRFVKVLTEGVGSEAVEEAYINRPGGDRPTLVISPEKWLEVARLLLEEESLAFDYLENLSGVDEEDHMEILYHLTSLTHGHDICVKVKTGREEAEVPSVTGVWRAADWHEREIYDLLGVRFTGHPNLERILMPKGWVGHPLRKDYKPYDGGV